MSLGHGCGMIPMMFPGIQQYMPAMGIGMGMRMGMNPPVVPYPPATPMGGPRFPLPAFPMPPPFAMAADPSRILASNHTDPMLNSNPPPFPAQTQVTPSMVSCISSLRLNIHLFPSFSFGNDEGNPQSQHVDVNLVNIIL